MEVRYGTSEATDGNCRTEEDRKTFLRGLGFEEGSFICCEQVHGLEIGLVQSLNPKVYPRVDGLATQLPGIVLGIFTADCVPVFLFCKEPRAVALLHAGWRGVVGNISAQGVSFLKEKFGCEPSQIKVQLGPHIRECCFKVGEDVASQFSKRSVHNGNDALTVSLEKEILGQLMGCGILKENIESVLECTVHNQKFFSYRRDKTHKRMVSYIVINEKIN